MCQKQKYVSERKIISSTVIFDLKLKTNLWVNGPLTPIGQDGSIGLVRTILACE